MVRVIVCSGRPGSFLVTGNVAGDLNTYCHSLSTSDADHKQYETCKYATRISQQKSQRYVQVIFSVLTLGNKEIFFFPLQFLYSFQTSVKFSGHIYCRYPIPHFVKNVQLMRLEFGRTHLCNYLRFDRTHADGKTDVCFFDMKHRIQA